MLRTPLRLITIALLAPMLLSAEPADATQWIPLSNIDPTTEHDDYFPIPAITPDGTVWAIWDGVDPVELDEEIYYSRWNGSSWSPPETINPPNQTSERIPRVHCAEDGALWVLWKSPLGEGSAPYAGLASHWNGAAWSTPDTIWVDGTRQNNTDFYAVSSSEAWFVREGVGGSIVLYHRNGVARDTTTFDLPGASGYQPTIAVDSTHTVWAAWTHEEPYPVPPRLEFVRMSSGVWSQPQIIPVPVSPTLPRLTIDRDNTKWIVCAGDEDPSSPYQGDDIWALRWTGTKWNPVRISDRIQSNDSLQVWNAVSRTPTDYPRAVWVRANIRNYTRYDVLSSTWNGVGWSAPELVGALEDSAYVNWPEVAVRGDRSCIAWMVEPKHAPFVFNIVAVQSVRATTSTSSVSFQANVAGSAARLSWSADVGTPASTVEIYRLDGVSSTSKPDLGSTLVAQIEGERSKESSLVDRVASAGTYTYWLRLILADGVLWAGPRSVLVPAHPRYSQLSRTAPNPTSGSVALLGVRGTDSPVVRIYDIRGRLVRTLGPVSPLSSIDESFSVLWDGRDNWGSVQPSGVYFARLAGPIDQGPTLKLLLIR